MAALMLLFSFGFAQEETALEESPESSPKIILSDGQEIPLSDKELKRVLFVLKVGNYEEMRAHIENLKILEEAELEIELDDIVVIIDEKERIYVKKIEGKWQLGYMQGDLEVETDNRVFLKPEKENFFSLHLKMAFGVGTSIESSTNRLLGHYQIGLALQTFKIGRTSLDVAVTSDAYLVGLAYGLTQNSSVMAMGGRRWEGEPTAAILFAFKF